jgi:hypothetical protein
MPRDRPYFKRKFIFKKCKECEASELVLCYVLAENWKKESSAIYVFVYLFIYLFII